MIYFDTDVIIHAIVEQDAQKRAYSSQLLSEAFASDTFAISTLTIQEVGLALSKLGLGQDEVAAYLNFFGTLRVFSVTREQLARAVVLAHAVGFKNINDCVHTAVAESRGCTMLCTYNKSDFKRIQNLTQLPVTIL
ncbi:type II toxin-antitoxin system VapC family toxin [Dyadobacter sandarakinus]|uniref:Ribonuclease VapC n=1 Tax=Dyadobacter sandarakinus TaxID=2747268 RepID=A0ABX7IBK8_9BACT|nr:type II toxin-antitoxin system VapC family toxin [Dyadobacter sandarakinus]QRR03300.1 type II toxin-antitoxin system VapC family toxin [Dyadobacter sandarakinus]